MSATPKKRAGRPPKNKSTADEIEVLGIVDRANDETHIAEVFITRLTIFKKLLSLYNDYDMNEILLIFKPDKFIMRAYREETKVLIETIIEGDKCNRYYCGKEISMYIECDSIMRLNSYIEPEYDYEFEIAVKPYRDKKLFVMDIMNKSTKQKETMESLEMKPQNKLYGPVFDNIERTWPIAFKGISKSFKRKFSGLIRNYNSVVRFSNDSVAKLVEISARTLQLIDGYDLITPALDIEENADAPEIFIHINIKPMKLFLKNAVDEKTKFFINQEKLVCLASKLGKVKNKGSVIGSTKVYYWETRRSIEPHLPEAERLMPEILPVDEEPTRKTDAATDGEGRKSKKSLKGPKSSKNSTRGKTPGRPKMSTNKSSTEPSKKAAAKKSASKNKKKKPKIDTDDEESD